MVVVEAEVVSESRNPGGILPVAVVNDGLILDGTEEYSALMAAFSSPLEAFGSVALNLSADQHEGQERQRTFFLYATIEGMPERIPVYGLKETRKIEGNGTTFLKLDIFLFFGQERSRIGMMHVTLAPGNVFQEFRILSDKGSHQVLSGNVVNGQAHTYDNKGGSIHTFSKKPIKKKTKYTYHVNSLDSSHTMKGTLELDIQKVGWTNKRVKELKIKFTDPEDYTAKAQIVLSALMVLYMHKL